MDSVQEMALITRGICRTCLSDVSRTVKNPHTGDRAWHCRHNQVFVAAFPIGGGRYRFQLTVGVTEEIWLQSRADAIKLFHQGEARKN